MANNLRYYRLKHGLSVDELCDLTYGSKNHNTIFVHEMKHLTVKAAYKYAEVLGENVFDILGEEVFALMPKTKEDRMRVISLLCGDDIEVPVITEKHDTSSCKNSFGAFVKTNRLKLLLSEWELAKRIGITNAQLSNVERGCNLPQVTSLKRYAEALNVDINELRNIYVNERMNRE